MKKREKKIKIGNTDRKRRKLNIWISIITVFAIFLALLGGAFGNMVFNSKNFEVEFYKISSDKIEKRIRVIFISDLHLREYGKDNADLLDKIKDLSPDIIAIGGDLVVNDNPEYSNMVSFCEKLTKICPVYGVLGNHEDVRVFIHKDTELVSRFEKAGVRVLRNEYEKIDIKGSIVTLIGVEGSPANFDLYGANKFMDGYEAKKDDSFAICISHVPLMFEQKLSKYSFDLGLAGHVHGGIIRVPGLGGLYSREEGILPSYDSGKFDLENNAELIVSRGLGDSGFTPRLNNIPELSVIDIS